MPISDNDRLVLDTSIVIHYLRADSVGIYVESTYHLRNRGEVPIISIVTHAEVLSFANRRNWGEAKKDRLTELIREFVVIPVDTQEIVDEYAKIDNYATALPSSQKMGKNDLWIAATASLANARLLTTDRDFERIGGIFFHLALIDPSDPRPETTKSVEML